jgi:hypothetical protein
MILVLAYELVEAQNLARPCMPPLACMLPPALILMLAWILVLLMILVLAYELVEAQNLAQPCMPPPACMLLPALILVLHMILMPVSRLYASTSRATYDSYASITSLVMDWLIVIIEQGNSLRAAL